MPLTEELILQLTPSIPAPGELDIQKQYERIDSNRLRRLAWTQFLRSDRPLLEHVFKIIPSTIGRWHLGAGLIPTLGLPIEAPVEMMAAIHETQYTWGIILAVPPFAELSILEERLDFEQRIFPIIISPTSINLQDLTLSSSHNAAVGSRTTWASANPTTNSAASPEGLLTARHVPDRCGQNQLWSSEVDCTYRVYRRGSAYVDASYLEGHWGNARPNMVNPKPVSLMGAGDNVTLKGAYSTVSGFITHLPHSQYIGGGSPSHVFLSMWGTCGDSGGLIHEQDTPISMYLGKTTLKDGSHEGLSLSLEQVVNDLEINIFL